jgi:hypothetical protein
VPLRYRFRGGEANMRPVWLCARNDAVGNAAALLMVFGTRWPAAILGTLAPSGGW